MIAKAEALYNICDFEHSLVLFTRAKKVAPDSAIAQNGVSKSTKTILNKISNQSIFTFKNSRTFYDFLRREGPTSVEKFMNNENKFKIAVALKASIAKCQKPGIQNVVESINSEKVKVSKSKSRMKEDKKFLKNLEKSLICLNTASVRDSSIRFDMINHVSLTPVMI